MRVQDIKPRCWSNEWEWVTAVSLSFSLSALPFSKASEQPHLHSGQRVESSEVHLARQLRFDSLRNIKLNPCSRKRPAGVKGGKLCYTHWLPQPSAPVHGDAGRGQKSLGVCTVGRGSVIAPLKMFRSVVIYVCIYKLLMNNSTTHFTLILTVFFL